MGALRKGIGTKGFAIALAVAAGLCLVTESALADRFRSNSSAGPHNGGGHFHNGGGNFNHRHFAQPRVFVRPAFPARRFYYVPGPFFYSPPAYYPPPVAYAPPVLPSMNNGYLYFCPASQAYYPQVLECTQGWMQVSPNEAPPG